MSVQHFGLVLAGGLSSRMGKDKALLTLNKMSLLDKAQQCLEGSLCSTVLISRNTGEGIKDNYHALGPLAGIEAAIANINQDVWLTIMPVDMPLLRTQELLMLQHKAVESQSAVYFNSFYLPCVIKVCKELREYLVNALEGRHARSIYAMLTYFCAIKIPVIEASYLENINTRADWLKLQNYLNPVNNKIE